MKCNRVYYTAVELCAHILYLYQLTQTVLRDHNLGVLNSFAYGQHIIMPHRCIDSGCSNTRNDGESLHKMA